MNASQYEGQLGKTNPEEKDREVMEEADHLEKANMRRGWVMKSSLKARSQDWFRSA
jgi:hypothetical protein